MWLIPCLLAALSAVLAQQPAKRKPAAALPPVVSPAALRAHVSFLAADAMQGRDTPSRELDIAAEYIAS